MKNGNRAWNVLSEDDVNNDRKERELEGVDVDVEVVDKEDSLLSSPESLDSDDDVQVGYLSDCFAIDLASPNPNPSGPHACEELHLELGAKRGCRYLAVPGTRGCFSFGGYNGENFLGIGESISLEK